jgi:acyl dehydratase
MITDSDSTFDPTSFTIVEPRAYEQLRVGEVFRALSRSLSDAQASAFQTVSADNHPVHNDGQWARAHGHSTPVMNGLQVLAFTAPGATLFPHPSGEVLTGLSCQFLGEAHAGDTLYPQLTITALTPDGPNGIVRTAATVRDQRAKLALSGEPTYLLRRTAVN